MDLAESEATDLEPVGISIGSGAIVLDFRAALMVFLVERTVVLSSNAIKSHKGVSESLVVSPSNSVW